MEWVWSDPHVLAVRAMEVLGLASVVPMVAKEWKGETLPYSKFAPPSSSSSSSSPPSGLPSAAATKEKKVDDTDDDPNLNPAVKIRMIPSRPAMLIIYSPALFLCSCFLLLQLLDIQYTSTPPRLNLVIPHPLSHFFFFFLQHRQRHIDSRLLVFASAITLHFLKRDLEVLFLHKYSGAMEIKICFTISFAYFYSCASAFYALQVAINSNTSYSTNLMGYGVVMFILGIAGNFYHHYLLACLRSKKSTSSKKANHQYVTPQGGLFSLVVCPHYLFEFIDFLGLAMISQTTLSFISAFVVLISLAMRSQSTKLWYLKKIEDFPRDRKCFLPYIF